MEELRIPCPSGLRTRQLKDLSETELLYAVNCLPASPQGGLYLWRPQLDPQQGIKVIDSTHRLLAVCRFRDGLAILHGDPAYNQLRLTLIRRNATGLYIPDSKYLSPFRQASIQEASMSQVGHSFLAIATDHYGLLLAEVSDDFVITDWYLVGGVWLALSRSKPGRSKNIAAGLQLQAEDRLLWDTAVFSDLSSTDRVPVFITTVSYKVARRSDAPSDTYEIMFEVYKGTSPRTTLFTAPERYTSVATVSNSYKVVDLGTTITFSVYKKFNITSFVDGVEEIYLALRIYNRDTTNPLGLSFAAFSEEVRHEGLLLQGFTDTDPIASDIGGTPVCRVLDAVRNKTFRIGKVGTSGSYIIAPSSEDTIAIGDPVSLRFSTEVPLQGRIFDIQASGSTAVVSTSAESYIVDLPSASPKSLLPTAYDVAVPTSAGIFVLFKGRLFRILQNSAIEVATALESVEADHMTYIDDYGVLLLTKSGSEEMLAYSEYSGKWVYWRLDEVGGGVRALHYNDGILLTSDFTAYPLTHTQLDQSYETALYIITPVLPALSKFSLQALELEGDLFITDEQNAQISVTSLSDNQSAYLLQQIGTPWWNMPPLHAFGAGGTGGQHTGADPVSTEPFQGQPVVFNGVLGVDLRSTQYEQGVFPVGRRFILGLNVGSSEKKSLFSVLLGFRLYGRPVGTSLVGG